MSAREDIAAAASGVDGINVSPYYSQTPRPGYGYVRMAQKAPDANFSKSYVDTWEVVIALSQDVVSAEKFLEQIQADLVERLAVETSFVSLIPTELIYDGGSIPGVVFTGTREG